MNGILQFNLLGDGSHRQFQHRPIWWAFAQAHNVSLWQDARLCMYRQANNQIYKTVVVVWLTLSIASVMLAAVIWLDLSRKLEAANEAVAIQSELDNIFKLLLDAETSQRGFTISGD